MMHLKNTTPRSKLRGIYVFLSRTRKRVRKRTSLYMFKEIAANLPLTPHQDIKMRKMSPKWKFGKTNSMNFKNTLENYQKQIESAMDELLPASNTRPARLHQAMRYSLQAGGKRLRPILVLASHQLFPSKTNPFPVASHDRSCRSHLQRGEWFQNKDER